MHPWVGNCRKTRDYRKILRVSQWSVRTALSILCLRRLIKLVDNF